jgi:2-polyprenyl-6-methoxyphenol hydroxylase-like FAD-dependent oxidoreductase
MTDTEKHRHRHTIPVGKMRSEVWDDQKARGSILPEAFQEVMAKAEQPFISAIRDSEANQAIFMSGRLFLVGDALSLFRPHIGASTNQAAVNAMEMERLFKGEITPQTWEKITLSYARKARLLGITMGTYFQFGFFAALPWLFKYILAILSNLLGFSLISSNQKAKVVKKSIE